MAGDEGATAEGKVKRKPDAEAKALGQAVRAIQSLDKDTAKRRVLERLNEEFGG